MSGAAYTPGPWEWMGSELGGLHLATIHSGRLYVMGFKRRGLQGAEPTFRSNNRMVPATELVRFEVGDGKAVGMSAAKADPSVYRYDFEGIANADARLIAAAPELLEAAREGLICAAADLEARLALCAEHDEDPEQDAILQVFRARHDLISAAIAKATGR